MEILPFTIAFLALFVTCYGYTCPDSDTTFYHADVSTGCQVYHLCEGSHMKTLTCPFGKAFDHHTQRCTKASLVHCTELEHHHHKRSVELVHSISKQELKKSAKEILTSIQSIARKTFQELTPSMYEKFQTHYAPVIRSIKNEFEPYIKIQVLPRITKFEVYARRMGSKLFEKIHRSYELSNSTHINVVSFADIFEEISNDLQPFLKLGRYFSSRLIKNTRTKRETGTPITDVPELLLGYLEPALKDIFSSATSMFSGNDNTLLSKVIMPVLLEIKNDEESMLDVKKIFWSSKAAFSPLMFDMLNRQSFDDPEGTIIRVPRSKIAEAKAYFHRETKPLISKLLTKHLPTLLSKLSENTKLIFSSIERIKLLKSEGNGAVLRDDIMRFIRKHSALWKSESGSHVSSYTITEIKKDLKPIEIGFVKFVLDYVDQMEDSWLKILFGRNSFLTQTLLGGSETYAVPSGIRESSVSVPNRNAASPSRIKPIASQLSPKSSSSISAAHSHSSLRSNLPTRNQNIPFIPVRGPHQYSSPPTSRNIPSRTLSNSARRGSTSVAAPREYSKESNYWYDRYRQALQG